MEYVLGIDIGTGSVKAVAVNLQGRAVEAAQYTYSFESVKPGYHEQDPEQIWNAFKNSINDVIQQTGSQPLSISLSSAMHSLIAVNEEGGALAPMITWADNRSSAIANRLKASAEGMSIYSATGTPIHPMSPLCKIIWIRENDPALFRNTHKFISIKEYIWFKLFNEFKIDHSIASCTGLFDIYQLVWHVDALFLAGISEQLLAEPVPTNYLKNSAQHPELAFLASGIPVVIGASDGCLANLGSMATRPGVAVMTIGTSGAVRITSPRPLPNQQAMTFSYILDNDTFICGGPINNGGIALQWWMRQQGEKTTDLGKDTALSYAQFFEQIAMVPAGSEGLIFLPYLTGERAPIWDSESSGAFFGIKLLHQHTYFSRSVLEGICYAMRDVLESITANYTIDEVYINGGFVRSAVWVQMLADIIGKRVLIVQTEDASATGAAYLAMKTIGLISTYPTAAGLSLKIVEPDPQNSAVYSKNFSIFKKIYSNLKENMHNQ